MADAALVQLDHVRKSFPGVDGAQRLAILDDLCLEVRRGETIAIVGPSGSGKSTVLNLVGGLDRPTQGKVAIEGKDLSALKDYELSNLRNRTLGFIFQGHHLLPHCSVWENVLVPALANQSATDNETMTRAKRLLDRVGLGSRLGHRPAALSGGERQRVAVVRALIMQPSLLLADEPTGALDATSAERLAALLLELNDEEKTALIVVTHSRELASKMSRIYTLKQGKLEVES